MSLLLCYGECDSCLATNECPMKEGMQAEKRKDAMKTALREMLDGMFSHATRKVTPENLIEICDINLPQIMQLLDILTEAGTPMSLAELLALLKSQKPELFQAIPETEPKPAQELNEKSMVVIALIAERIHLSMQRKCPAEECRNCFLTKECKQKQSAV